MSTNFNLFFYLKEPKRYKSGPIPVYLRITINCQRSEIAVGREIDPADWNLEKRRARGTKEAARQLNYHLDTIQSKIQDVHTVYIMEMLTTLFRAKLTQGLADFWVAANAIKARTKIVI